MMRRLLLLLPMIVLLSASLAQQLRGKIIDKESGEFVQGIVLTLFPENRKTVSDEEGNFLFDSLQTGVYQITSQGLGYERNSTHEVWIKSVKPTFIFIELIPSVFNFDEIIITDEKWPVLPGMRTITEEQVNRFAATYSDPARLFLTSPDAAVSHDQNNQIAIRGLSPEWNVWRINGAEVVNPNHLSNAGTSLDQPTANGGGVNALSAQMLESGTLHYGNTNFGIANQTAGVFDLRLKDGNSFQTSYTTVASLLGMDAAINGPITREKDLLVAANYRYSFTGLLGLLGIRFNGEKISFQDLAIQLTKKKKKSNHRFYGFIGHNSNLFRDTTRQEINFYSQLGLVGYQITKPRFEYTINYSFNNFQREELIASAHSNNPKVLVNDTKMNKALLSQNTIYKYHIGAFAGELGGMVNLYQFSSINSYLSARPFSTIYFAPNRNFKILLGAGWLFEKKMWSNIPDLRSSIKYWKNLSSFEIYGGLLTQNLYSFDHHFIYQLTYNINEKWIPRLSTSFKSGLIFSTEKWNWQFSGDIYVQYIDRFETPLYATESEQKISGISFSLNRSYDNNYYVLAGINIFSSQWNKDIHNPFDSRYTASGSMGKTFTFSKNGKVKIIDFHLKTLQVGARKQTIAFNPSNETSVWLYDEGNIAAYFRLDAKISLKKQKKKFSTFWSLDIQNVLNKENEGFVYYNQEIGRLENSPQLGMVPILAYRLDF